MKDESKLGRSRRAVIADQIRQDILTGVLKPLQAITLSDLAERFGVSVTPVREAVLSLADEGLVDMQTRKGIRVAELKVTDIEDIFGVYAMVAGTMAERATTRISADDVEQLKLLLDMEAASTEADELEHLNWQFHAVLNRRADYLLLRSIARMLTRNIPSTYFFQIPKWREASYADHRALLRAVRSRDATGARLIAEEHVRKGGEMLTNYLATIGYWRQDDLARATEKLSEAERSATDTSPK